MIDTGSWAAGDVSGCSYSSTMVITEGGGTILMRTDNDTADYTMVSVREVDDAVGTLPHASWPGTAPCNKLHFVRAASGFVLSLDRQAERAIPCTIHDLRGQMRFCGIIGAGARIITIRAIPAGTYLIRIGSAHWRTICFW